MALIICKECNQAYSSEAKNCVHCGVETPAVLEIDKRYKTKCDKCKTPYDGRLTKCPSCDKPTYLQRKKGFFANIVSAIRQIFLGGVVTLLLGTALGGKNLIIVACFTIFFTAPHWFGRTRLNWIIWFSLIAFIGYSYYEHYYLV